MHLSHQNVIWISVAHLMLYDLLKYSSSARASARPLVYQYIKQQTIYSTHIKLVGLSDALWDVHALVCRSALADV